MKGSDIASLLIRFGPIALDWIIDLVGVWNKEMTPDEVRAFVAGKRKSYDDYIEAERARRAALTP